MGQPINVHAARVVGDVAIVDGDRSISGQDGGSYSDAAEASAGETLPARLANRIMTADPAVDHVFAGSNAIVARRPGGWDDPSLATLQRTIEDFFVFYEENRT